MLKKLLIPIVMAAVGYTGLRTSLHYLNQTPVYSEAFIEYREMDKRIESAYSRNVVSNPDSTEIYQDLISRVNSLAKTNEFAEDIRKENREEMKRELLPWIAMGSLVL